MRAVKIILVLLILVICSCGQKAELGSKKNPIKMYFVPSMEAGKIVTSGKAVSDYLSEKTGYYFKVAVPTSYASVIEAIGTNETISMWFVNPSPRKKDNGINNAALSVRII